VITVAVEQKGFLSRIELFGDFRLHFFATKITQVYEDESYAHTHKTMFGALVLQGGYTHHVYAETKDEKAQANAFVLEKNGFRPLGTKIGLEEVGQDELAPGSGYVLSSTTFHTLSDFKDDTMTLVVRSQNP